MLHDNLSILRLEVLFFLCVKKAAVIVWKLNYFHLPVKIKIQTDDIIIEDEFFLMLKKLIKKRKTGSQNLKNW